GSGSRSISAVMFPAAISRSATTVGLSFSQGTVGSAPLARRRARCAANSTSWNRLSTLPRQSSTVILAMVELLTRPVSHYKRNRRGLSSSAGREPPAGPGKRWARAGGGLPSSHPYCPRAPASGGHEPPAGRLCVNPQQALQQRRELGPASREVLSPALHNPHEILDGPCEVIVDDHVVELVPVRHVSHRIPEAALDDSIRIRLAPAQSFFERGARGGQDENGATGRQGRAHLAGALPVDLQNDVVTLGQLGFYRRARRAIQIVEDARVLEKLTVPHRLLELRDRDEVVLPTRLLRRALRPRRVGNRHVQLGLALEQRFHERGLAGAGRRGNHEWLAPCGVVPVGGGPLRGAWVHAGGDS